MNGIHARLVLAKQKRQILRNQRQGRVHGKERVLAYQEKYDTLHSLDAQLIEVDGTHEAQTGDRRDALQSIMRLVVNFFWAIVKFLLYVS